MAIGAVAQSVLKVTLHCKKIHMENKHLSTLKYTLIWKKTVEEKQNYTIHFKKNTLLENIFCG